MDATTTTTQTGEGVSRKFHSVKVPRLYKEAAKALKQVEENGEGLKNAIHSLKHPNVKGITALVSEALKHYPQLEVILEKSKLFKKEVGLSKQAHLAKILITELLWGKKRLGGESKPIVTVVSYQEKFEKILGKIERKGDHDKGNNSVSIGGAEAGVLAFAVYAFCLPNFDCCSKVTQSNESDFKKPRYARVNTLKINLDAVISFLQQEGWVQVENVEYYDLGPSDFIVDSFVENLLVFASGTELHNHSLYLDGSLILQDKASCLAALALKPRKGREIIDACAAPGMKTSMLAAITSNESHIIAVEKSSKRFETLKSILEGAGATNVTSINQNFTDLNPEDYKDVEYILVDPSCSGSGMFGRLEIQLQQQSSAQNAERLQKLQYYQQKLLRHAMKFPSVKRIVYSTCSINSEENEDVVAAALDWINTAQPYREEAGLHGIDWVFRLKRALPNWPHRVTNNNYTWADMCVKADESDFTDGFFVSTMERIK